MTQAGLVRQLQPPATPIERSYGLFAVPIAVETNDPQLLEAAELSLGRFAPVVDGRPLRLRLYAVDRPQAVQSAEWHVDYRTDGRLYSVTTPDSVGVADVDAGEAYAFVGPRMRTDVRAVRREIVEGLCLAMATGGRGYTPIHAAGIGRHGIGVALVGPAGAGKSTLTLAAARAGLEVFAEDAIYARAVDDGSESGLEMWGMPWIQRLLPDALDMFPELSAVQPMLQANGEAKLEVDLDEWFPTRARPCARPRALVLLQRRPGPTRLTPLTGDDAAIELLWPWRDWSAANEAAADRIAALPAYRLEVGATPEAALEALDPLLNGRP